MHDAEAFPEIGEIVQFTKGRDAGQHAVVISILDERFVLVADGDKRKYDRPKRKNINHLLPLSYISREVRKSIEESGRVTNARLRYAIAAFQSEQSETKEGE
ncbi:KOW domain-containing RNA-binding protein [Salsuginibacillus kocurii]|uniref:KOW domain-containing RNA-binding protein n=1 Tax=Salsuginibacillus kocurii TaxID=427078 RepID=UPI000380FF11|nr:KOW domain-containing RNA-binding protein [Salsuginibacillus kocurii]